MYSAVPASLPANYARIAALMLWSVLLLLVVMHQLVPALSGSAVLRALLFSLPLFAPLRGLLRGDRYTYSWATLCVLPYFLVGVTEAVANPALHVWATSLLGASLLWFFSLISFLRFTRK